MEWKVFDGREFIVSEGCFFVSNFKLRELGKVIADSWVINDFKIFYIFSFRNIKLLFI